MEDWYLPKKLLRPFVIGLLVVALIWGLISGDMTNAGKVFIEVTKPISERIEKRLLRVIERVMQIPEEAKSDSGV